MVELPVPLVAAVVATPLLKLLPEYCEEYTPGASKALSTTSTNICMGLPSLNVKRGPGDDHLHDRYASMAATGHRGQSVCPIKH